MPLMFYVVLIQILVRIGTGVVRKPRTHKSEPLCASCSFVHMQYAMNGKRAISCTFGAGARPITIDVLYCTDYRDRTAPPRLVKIGFSPTPREAEVMKASRRGACNCAARLVLAT